MPASVRRSTATPPMFPASAPEFHAFSLKEPAGVAGLIIPWNSPLSAALKQARTLSRGRVQAAILKPGRTDTAQRVTFGRVGIGRPAYPAGVLNVRDRHRCGGRCPHPRAHPDVDKISFTRIYGSRKASWFQAARPGNLKRLSLELGGKIAGVRLCRCRPEDGDPRRAGPQRIFPTGGQICYAGSPLFVAEKARFRQGSSPALPENRAKRCVSAGRLRRLNRTWAR